MIVLYLIISVIIAGSLFLNKNAWVNRFLILIFIAIQCTYTGYEVVNKDKAEIGYFLPDALAILLLITLTIISIAALLHSYDYIYKEKDNPHTRGVYYGAMVLFIMALTAAYLSSHIAVTWIFVEITTLSASALIFHRRNSGSIEATWKYIFVCSVSLALVFIGILFLSMAPVHATEDSLQYKNLIMLAPELKTDWLKLAFLFIFSGYTVKMGLVPMYTAGIDAKDKAPTPSAALFSSVLMNVGFLGIFRLYCVVAGTTVHAWADNVILIAALLSVFVATVYMLKVKNIKRMLAYSSIEHMGIVALGLAAGGIGYYAAILHLILHSFAKSSFFFQIGHLYKTFKSKNIAEIGDYFRYNPTGAIFILLAFICITAMPPSGLFISEFYVFKSLFMSKPVLILIVLLILLTTIIWAMGNSLFRMLFVPAEDKTGIVNSGTSRYETLMQFFLLALVIYLGIFPPEFFVNLINEATQFLNN
jgi:hydrogenase-4 component F